MQPAACSPVFLEAARPRARSRSHALERQPHVLPLTTCLLPISTYDSLCTTHCLTAYHLLLTTYTHYVLRTTQQEEGGPVEYLCLVEVWHTSGGNEIRQAEGPRPRTIPGPEAWYWLNRWCSREGIDLSTWDCYS